LKTYQHNPGSHHLWSLKVLLSKMKKQPEKIFPDVFSYFKKDF